MSEWYIHLWKCPVCGKQARADRKVPCWKCGTEMELQERQIGTIEHD